MTCHRCVLTFWMLALFLGDLARADLTVVPTFDSSITSNANAGEIESGINSAISRIESEIENPITVNIDFTAMSSGLGQSDTYTDTLSYPQYITDLRNNQTLSSYDDIALSSLPFQINNPVNSNSDVELTLPLLRALGVDENPPPGQSDSTISLNLSLLNLTRTGPQNPEDYDLQAVVAHEMDEVLGAGGAGSQLGFSTTGPVGPMDLFRYRANGVRSFTTRGTATSYFSIDGGATNLSNFNQDGSGDYGDWGTNATPQVQDAFGTPGVDLDVGSHELTSLDVIGYNLTPAGTDLETGAVPEPSTWILLLGGVGLLLYFQRRLR